MTAADPAVEAGGNGKAGPGGAAGSLPAGVVPAGSLPAGSVPAGSLLGASVSPGRSEPPGEDRSGGGPGYAPAVARPRVAPAKARSARPARPARPAKRSRKVAPVPAKRVRRVVRKVDTWTVLRFSVLFYLCLLVVLLVAGCLLWAAASSAGIIHNIENFIKDLFALDSFHFNPANILEGTIFGGLVLVLLGTGINVLAAVIYNLISDVVGGIEVLVLEEDVTAPRRPVI